jgi:hypothetical protein
MKANELQKINNSLSIEDKKDKILIEKRGYFLYYNDPNKKVKDIKVHRYDCGFCAWGSGNGRESKIVGRNGVWIGPFDTVEQAEYFTMNVINIDKVSIHSCCEKNK